MASRIGIAVALCALFGAFVRHPAAAQSPAPSALERQLLAEPLDQLAAAARSTGDATRGAIVFHQPHLACQRCHNVERPAASIAPDLTRLPADVTDEQLVESVLQPSKAIRKGFETTTILTHDGRLITGIVAQSTPERVTLRDPTQPGKTIGIPVAQIDERKTVATSIMPAGQVGQLGSRQQFLDLIKYLIELRTGGPDRARQLQPAPALIALELPEYEQRVDHAGLLRSLDSAALERGRAIYERLCVNCHGTVEQPGSLPTSLRFAQGKFKSGADPYTMYQTLTRGFGLMTPQSWMVPQQKYDVIHYIRETYLKPHNPTQFVPLDDRYLAALPAGNTRGPAPRTIEPWATMDYGPTLINTYEIGRDGSNFAYKGIAVRLDPGPGGVARGRQWMIFDHDTLRVAAAWTGRGFIDWQGIHFDGRHGAHPHVVGDVQLANPTGPGWANPATGKFDDDQRVIGRDGRRYGPLPRNWGRYRGLYHQGDQAIIAYEVADAAILESPRAAPLAEPSVAFGRALRIGPRQRELLMLVATHPDSSPATLSKTPAGVRFGAAATSRAAANQTTRPLQFDGATVVELRGGEKYDMAKRDFTIAARLKTRHDGTIFAKTKGTGPWVPNGVAWFIRDGRLVYDVGWVGAAASNRKINDNQWHDVALRWRAESGLVEFFVDGQEAGRGTLKPAESPDGFVARIGYAASDFPAKSHFTGELRDVRFFSRAVSKEEVARVAEVREQLVAHWPLDTASGQREVLDKVSGKVSGIAQGASEQADSSALLAQLRGAPESVAWTTLGERLCLRIPAGDEPLRFDVWWTRETSERSAEGLATFVDRLEPLEPLEPLPASAAAHWPQTIVTKAALGADDGPFAVDVLTHPVVNPWLAQVRLTGLDFLPGGEEAVLSAWDGDVWRVSGLRQLSSPAAPAAPESPARDANQPPTLTWRRIASGLFQPLGIKYVDGRIYVTCRDQLTLLHDRNDDGEIDFYECWNNDHQVTEHFHEFAMGLQVDAEGNFYYAKSARHALPAIVPHHGTLLRVSRDGSTTEILARGFRAANGVCLNPDGSFVVTDQEGHWNPKNRINWVERGGFYGNMFGYHDVNDSSDSAMAQPLCWITNAFDRSPAELLWTPKDAWGRLGGSLLNLSYGYGRIHVVPFEDVSGQKQGGLCALPIASLPTGVMRGRFHPLDRQLYACGMFAWAGNATQPGGWYRIRATGKPMYLLIGLKCRAGRIELTWTDPVDAAAARDRANYAVKTWSLKRSADYGSKHYDERPLEVEGVEVSADGRVVTLIAPGLQPTWGMEISVKLRTSSGERIERVIHNSIFRLDP